MDLANSLVHQQYARKADIKGIMDRLASALPSAFTQLQSYISCSLLSVMSIFIYYSESLNAHSPDPGLNPMNSEQAQAKPKSQIPLLYHGSRRRPAINLGREQSFMEGRHAAGTLRDSIPGDRLTPPRRHRCQCYGSTPSSKWTLAQRCSVYYS